MFFELIHTDQKSQARAGKIQTAHGEIPTPVFMPVGTVASVKGLHFKELIHDSNAPIILGNTYHLYLRPGTDILKEAGGIHVFTGWGRAVLTDSGGYQVFSLNDIRKLTDEGVTFHSHIDGSKHLFTPEKVIDIQRIIGSDIMMVLDECTPYPCDEKYARKSMELTHRWLERCVKQFNATHPLHGYSQVLFPIVQGSVYPELRKKSAETISGFNCEGNAIGGLSVGEPSKDMYNITQLVCQILPENKPRYLMGVGTPENLLECIERGVDMFDCVMPTRNGRNGMIFTRNGILNIKNEKWKNDFSSLDPEGTSFVDKQYSRAYVRHLFASREMLGPIIASQHNVTFYESLMHEARENILNSTFKEWKEKMIPKITRRL